MNPFKFFRGMAVALGVAAITTQAATAVQAYGQLKVSGNKILSQSGNAAVLRGMSLYWSIPDWQNPTQFWNANVVNWLAEDWHANVIRAAMGVDYNGGYLNNPASQKQYVSTVVDAAIAKGIYVIIDWHDHDAPSHQANAIAFFQEMARKYGNNPNVIYEVFNEPNNETWPEIKSYSTAVIQAIRAIDPDNLILVGSPMWDQDLRSPANSPITGYNNIAYTLHFYAGSHGADLRSAGEYAMNAGLAIFISEWGTSNADGNGGVFSSQSDEWLSWANANNLSWCNWSIHNITESSAALAPAAGPNGGWSDSQISLSGKYVRSKLLAANPAWNGYAGGASSSSVAVSSSTPISSSAPRSSSSVAVSSSTPVSSSSVRSSSSIAVSSSAVIPSSSAGSTTCIAFVNGTGNYDKNCYNAGLASMAAGTCYTMNPARVPSPQWINSNANDTYWWTTTTCNGGSISSSAMRSSSSVAISSSIPVSSSLIIMSSSAPISSSSIAISSSAPASSSSTGTGTCANPITFTSGSVTVGPAGICLKINASSYRNGVMASVRNNATAYTSATWWGGNDQNATSCTQTTKALSGNGAQFNNFVIGRDASGFSYLFIKSTDGNTYSVSVDAQNWQNGNGCGGIAPPLSRRLLVNPLPKSSMIYNLLGEQVQEDARPHGIFLQK